ncbi:MAG: GGDEF domain-containing protein [Nitrospirota bacterium]
MIKDEHKVIILSIIAGIAIWILDSAIDSFVFLHGSFWELLLFDLSLHEIYFRFLFFASFILFGIVVSKLISKRQKTEEELGKSVKFLDMIFDSIRDPFIILDRDFRVVKVNEAYAHMKDLHDNDLIGKRCYEITRGRDTVCDDCIVEKTFISADPCVKEKRSAMQGVQETWFEIYTYPIQTKNGSVTHVIEYVRNITERKKIEEERERLIQQLEFLSTTDSLTGLLNRRMLIKRLNSEIDRARRYGLELSLILCDLDYFKEINDTYGHNAGDSVLKSISSIFSELARKPDIIGRYGGDEFMIILPETSIKGAEDMAERIRLRVQSSEFPVVDGKSARTTMSLGITHFKGGEVDIYDLINRIDKALYTSKRTGKNQVYTLT